MEHAKDLGARLRASDSEEVMAACGMDGVQALTTAISECARADSWFSDGKLVMISGVSSVSDKPEIGVVWMLASDDVDRMPRCLVHGKREYVQELLSGRDLLTNFVDNRNTKAQRWLAWLGFTLGDPVPFGIQNLPFRPFWLSAHGEVLSPSPGLDS
jgi:hypothetical protein